MRLPQMLIDGGTFLFLRIRHKVVADTPSNPRNVCSFISFFMLHPPLSSIFPLCPIYARGGGNQINIQSRDSEKISSEGHHKEKVGICQVSASEGQTLKKRLHGRLHERKGVSRNWLTPCFIGGGERI